MTVQEISLEKGAVAAELSTEMRMLQQWFTGCACRAKRSGCNNADHPDQYGHYREAKFTMTKHHWWWKVQ